MMQGNNLIGYEACALLLSSDVLELHHETIILEDTI